MATIVIKDLSESVDLDRQAMVAISGGARTNGRRTAVGSTLFRNERIVDFRRGLSRGPLTHAGGRPAKSAPRK